jgi:hypothetical protein
MIRRRTYRYFSYLRVTWLYEEPEYKMPTGSFFLYSAHENKRRNLRNVGSEGL